MCFPDDSWLELSPEGLDEILHSAGNHKATTNADVLDLNKVAESMTAFVEKVSNIEGAEFPR